MRAKGHPVMGAIAGFFFGLSLSVFLLAASAFALNSVLVVVFPILFLVLGLLWGLWAPIGRGNAPEVVAAAPAGYAAPSEVYAPPADVPPAGPPAGPPPGPPPSA